ncbi:MAG: DUF488 domain-containing protein [Dehalococcoidia bacterium]|jgi:uncharacterized protein (DUF488 family)
MFTIGHSTRTIGELIELLKAHGVKRVVDVRTIPRSRHNPQFDIEALPQSLLSAGIVYEHIPSLGGLRHARKDSPNDGWRNASFRGFADYMQTEEFTEALERLIETSRREPTAILCAEALPWRCHRSLISDALTVRGVTVEDIIGRGSTQMHRLTPWARVEDGRVAYPAPRQGVGLPETTAPVEKRREL